MKKSYVLITGAFLVVIALAAYYLGYSAGIDTTTQITGAATLDVDSSTGKLPWFGILALVIASLTVVYAIFSEGASPIQEPAQQHFHYYQSLGETNTLQEAPKIQSQIAPKAASPAINNIHKKQPPKTLFRKNVFSNFDNSRQFAQPRQQFAQPSAPKKPEMTPEHAEIVAKLRQMRDMGLF